ncbi:ComEC/Rec2 family competence protein [Aureimonas phyllosphaerae]|uniref:ComEC/Rec2 family competence protein n=1 Tax=Aureimonas phyllosphaerae TaxID=1166078 RepID=UPI003A5BF3E1
MRAWLARQVALEERSRTAFALFPIAMIAAAATFYRTTFQPGLAAIALLAGVGALSLALPGMARSFRVGGVVGLGLAAGFAACIAERARTETTLFSGEATVRIAGPVLAREQDDRGRYRYIVEIESTERPVLSRPPERARIVVSSRHEPLPIGSTYRGLVRLRPPSGPAYPGAHDFAFGSYFGGLGAYGFSLGAPAPPGALRDPSISDRIATLRLAMGETIRAVLPGATGAVASALVTGERAGIPEEINEDLRVTGLAHVLSISGFHMALVAGFFLLVTRLGLATVVPMALRWPIKKLAAVVALVGTGFYFLLAGDNAATERSFVMIAVMLGAVLLDQPALTLRNVCIAAVVVIALSPHVVPTATFQMSFAATAALIGAYGAYARWQSRRNEGQRREGLSIRWLSLILLGMAMSSLIAGAATAPYAIYHFQRGAPFSLIANIVATPFFSFWIMPFAMLAVLAMPFGLHVLPLKAMGWGLDLVFALAAYLADAFPDYPTGLISGPALICFSAAILIVSFSASGLRWFALAPIAIGFALLRPGPAPELLLFEDGRELALIDRDGQLHSVQPRPSTFVWDQWRRALQTEPGQRASHSRTSLVSAPTTDGAVTSNLSSAGAFRCEDGICRGLTRSGLRIAWSDDYQKLDDVCRDSDIAIMARAVRANACRTGDARLVTLRTLRRTGSLAISRASDATIEMRHSIPTEPQAWNRHRFAAWPEYWRKSDSATAETTGRAEDRRAVSDSAGSAPPVSPGP